MYSCFHNFDALAPSHGELIQCALESTANKGNSKNKSIMVEYLTLQRQATLEALYSVSQSVEGDR